MSGSYSAPSSPIFRDSNHSHRSLNEMTEDGDNNNNNNNSDNNNSNLSTPTTRSTRSVSMSDIPLSQLYLPTALIDPRVYLFLEEDQPNQNIMFEGTTPEGRPLLRGATIEKLVQRMTYEKFPDPEFVVAFLTTYRRYATPSELLDLLMIRYNTPPPNRMALEDFKAILIPIR